MSYNNATNQWVRGDGTSAGNGATSNSNPYAHWAYDFQDIRTTYPAYTCIIAFASRGYDQ